MDRAQFGLAGRVGGGDQGGGDGRYEVGDPKKNCHQVTSVLSESRRRGFEVGVPVNEERQGVVDQPAEYGAR